MPKKKELYNRIKKYKKIKRLLSEENQIKKCGLIPFRYTKIGKGNEGIVYRLELQREPSLSLAVKVMKNDENNRREARNYDLFRDVVLTGRLPHFPLTWESIHCKDKCHFIDVSDVSDVKKQEWERIKEIKEKECFLLFTELFDGDADDLLKTEKKEKRKKELAVSLFFQMMMALKIINDKHLSHGDLHLHNVLYKKLEKKKEEKKKFRYVIGDDVYDVKHFDVLFIISDFEKMKPSGTVSAHAQDKKWLKTYVADVTFDKDRPLNSIYWDLFILTRSLCYFSKEFKPIRNKFLDYTQAYNKTKTGPSIEDMIRDFSSSNVYNVSNVISHKKRNEKEKKSKNTFFL